jgi:hypothetical protein
VLTRKARERAALTIAVLATVLAVVLSVAPVLSDSPARYSPQLAVLTATLIAVVWYTYFTFRAVHREEAGLVVYDLHYTPSDHSIDLKLENPTRRTVVAHAHTQVFLDDTEVEDLPPEFTGHPIRLTPLRTPSHHLDLPKLIEMRLPQDDSGYPPPRFSRIRAVITISWTDDLGGTGFVGPETYAGSLGREWHLTGEETRRRFDLKRHSDDPPRNPPQSL